jgi:Uncharacterized protein conserved in bacteria (DUF2188)
LAKGFIHTVHRDGVWINEVEGGGAIRGKHRTKQEAVKAARERAKREKTEHVVHNLDGKIGSRNSYGSDPRRSRG